MGSGIECRMPLLNKDASHNNRYESGSFLGLIV